MTTRSELNQGHIESQWQDRALSAAQAGEPAAVTAYRRLYAGVRWAPMPVQDTAFAARVLSRCGIVEQESGEVERKLVPTLFAAFGISGGIAAGPQLIGALTQLALDLTNLPWLQFGAAMSAIAAAAAVDRLLGLRRRLQRV